MTLRSRDQGEVQLENFIFPLSQDLRSVNIY